MSRHTRASLPPFRTLGDKLHHLAFLDADAIAAIEVIVDDLLTRRLDQIETAIYPVLRWPPQDE